MATRNTSVSKAFKKGISCEQQAKSDRGVNVKIARNRNYSDYTRNIAAPRTVGIACVDISTYFWWTPDIMGRYMSSVQCVSDPRKKIQEWRTKQKTVDKLSCHS